MSRNRPLITLATIASLVAPGCGPICGDLQDLLIPAPHVVIPADIGISDLAYYIAGAWTGKGANGENVEFHFYKADSGEDNGDYRRGDLDFITVNGEIAFKNGQAVVTNEYGSGVWLYTDGFIDSAETIVTGSGVTINLERSYWEADYGIPADNGSVAIRFLSDGTISAVPDLRASAILGYDGTSNLVRK